MAPGARIAELGQEFEELFREEFPRADRDDPFRRVIRRQMERRSLLRAPAITWIPTSISRGLR